MLRKKKSQKPDPQDRPQFDQTAAQQMASDIAAAEQRPAESEASGEQDKRAAQPDSPESLRAELGEARDRELRTQAELENYRKRATRQMQDERRYANLPLMRDLLPVLDNLDRAIEAAEKSHDASSLLEGVKLVAGQLEDVLKRHHCLQIEALNRPFDPHLHEAISQQPSDRYAANSVMQVTQSGFQLHDRVVRPSQVIVAAACESDQQAADEPAE